MPNCYPAIYVSTIYPYRQIGIIPEAYHARKLERQSLHSSHEVADQTLIEMQHQSNYNMKASYDGDTCKPQPRIYGQPDCICKINLSFAYATSPQSLKDISCKSKKKGIEQETGV